MSYDWTPKSSTLCFSSLRVLCCNCWSSSLFLSRLFSFSSLHLFVYCVFIMALSLFPRSPLIFLFFCLRSLYSQIISLCFSLLQRVAFFVLSLFIFVFLFFKFCSLMGKYFGWNCMVEFSVWWKMKFYFKLSVFVAWPTLGKISIFFLIYLFLAPISPLCLVYCFVNFF